MPTVANTHRPVLVNIPNPGNIMASTSLASTKKNKNKKMPDPVDTNKLLEQTMQRLEQDAAGNREQEQEIGAYPPS